MNEADRGAAGPDENATPAVQQRPGAHREEVSVVTARTGHPLAPFPWRDWLAPRYWPTWAGFGALWLLTRLPLDAVLAVGRRIGPLTMRLIPERNRITRTNLALALPELEPATRERIATASARHTGMSVMEIAWLWCRPDHDIATRFELEGREHVDAALAAGRGVILLQAHFTLIDFAGAVVGRTWPASAVYDPPKNPLFAALQLWNRRRFVEELISNRDVRRMVKRLRRGEIIWFSPDQAVNERHGGIPTRYFDQPVLSSSGTARILAMTGAALVPMIPLRLDDGRAYRIRFKSPVTIDTSDIARATQQVNDLLESEVHAHPEQYLWAHKRFKPPPGDAADPYR